MIRIRNAAVVKSGVKLFENFSWQIGAGEHWVITGPNGSGKTILMELIAGIVHTPQGELHFDFIKGNSWDERYAEKRRTIHYIPAHAIQSLLNNDHGLYYQQRYYGIGDERILSVRNILASGLERLNDMMIPESLSINHVLDLEVTRLSNGQLKKVLLLKTLLTEIPRFLLLDYPFEGLDHQSRVDLCDFIDHIATTYSIQIILVDHHHHLPAVMNRRLTLDRFTIVKEEQLISEAHESVAAATESIRPSPQRGKIPIVEINNLRIQYSDAVILNDFSWTVNKGERWALVGRNGAGKTTLFSMIFADHPMAYSQEIFLFGRRRGTGESIWDIKRRISYLGPELISYLAPKNILISARDYVRSINKKLSEEIFANLIDHFQAGNFIDKPVRCLSSGQLQLMLIMNCFLTDKELLLLDEPFQFLDERQSANLSRFLQSHIHQDTTLILITHYEKDLINWTEHTMRI